MEEQEKIITIISCPDKTGLIAQITSWYYKKNMNVVHLQQCTVQDDEGVMFFMRTEAIIDKKGFDKKKFEKEFSAFAKTVPFEFELFYSSRKERVALLVSKTSHCLYEVLSNYDQGLLESTDIPLIISNHNDLKSVAEKFNIPFYHLPIEGDKVEQEKAVISLLKKENIDLVVLARYMQILTPAFINEYRNRIINIHHGFLPAFQGANPYLQAFKRGVKIIGATAHYASEDLDQGPIIEQDVIRVNHEAGPAMLREMGKDIEKQTLISAIKAYVEHRIVVFKNKTIVFRKEQ